MPVNPPNILFIQADQMAAPALPVYGHPVVRAPHISGLAADGVVFDAAYCNSPLCAPSRFSMLSGQLPSRIGAYDNAAEFSAAHPTVAHYLRLMLLGALNGVQAWYREGGDTPAQIANQFVDLIFKQSLYSGD